MPQGNVTPPGPRQYADDTEIGVKAGAGMEIDPEPTQVETKVEAEDTAITTPETAPDSPKVEPEVQTEDEAGGESEHSSKLISEIGEDRKRLGEKLIELARSDSTAADQVKKLIEEDPKWDKFFKTKFGPDYDAIVKGDVLPPPEQIDLDQIRAEERARAKIEAIEEEDRKMRESALTKFAKTRSLNSEEFESFKETVSLLEGKYGFEESFDKAGLLVNKDKAITGTSKSPVQTGSEKSAPQPKKTTIQSAELNEYARRYTPGRSGDEVAKGLQRVEEQLDSEGRMTLRLD